MSSLDDRIFDQILETDDLTEAVEKPLHTHADLSKWLEERSNSTHVEIRHIPLEECKPWLYDEEQGCIRNEENTFFQIYGLKQYENNKCTCEQPIILQDEIGFLGHTYEVLSPAGKPCWRWSDAFHTAYRIHAKHTGG